MAQWNACAPGGRWADVFDDDSVGAECLVCTPSREPSRRRDCAYFPDPLLRLQRADVSWCLNREFHILPCGVTGRSIFKIGDGLAERLAARTLLPMNRQLLLQLQ